MGMNCEEMIDTIWYLYLWSFIQNGDDYNEFATEIDITNYTIILFRCIQGRNEIIIRQYRMTRLHIISETSNWLYLVSYTYYVN